MTIKIENAINGWVLTDHVDSEGIVRTVFAHEDTEKSEAEAFRDLLYTLIDLCGPHANNSRYAKHRIYIEIRPGDKCEATSEGE